MARYLITQTLLSSWQYVQDCAEGYEEEAMKSFLCTLRCEQEELSDEQRQNIQNGIDFEQAVYAEASGQMRPPHDKWEHGIQAVADFLRGAQFQVRVQREIEVAGMTFLVYGILDALRAGTIFDVKFKNKSFQSIDIYGSYLNSAQHPFYFYCVPEAREFVYLVSDGSDLYLERYTPEESRTAAEIIEDFITAMQTLNLLDTYKQFWAAKT